MCCLTLQSKWAFWRFCFLSVWVFLIFCSVGCFHSCLALFHDPRNRLFIARAQTVCDTSATFDLISRHVLLLLLLCVCVHIFGGLNSNRALAASTILGKSSIWNGIFVEGEMMGAFEEKEAVVFFMQRGSKDHKNVSDSFLSSSVSFVFNLYTAELPR